MKKFLSFAMAFCLVWSTVFATSTTLNYNNNAVLNVSGTIKNNTADCITGSVISAIYNGNELCNVEIKDNVTIFSGAVSYFNFDFPVANPSPTMSSKTMFWDNINGIKPIEDVAVSQFTTQNLSGISNTLNTNYMLVINTSDEEQSTGTLPVTSQNVVKSNLDTIDGNTTFIKNIHMPVYPFTKGAKSRLASLSMEYTQGSQRTFTVSNFVTDTDETINAKLLVSGQHCNVWVDVNETNFTTDMAQAAANEFDNVIYDKMYNDFGAPRDADGDGKVALLYYDIKDGFSGSGGYIAGYFSPLDCFATTDKVYISETEIANGRGIDMLHLDTYPALGINTYNVSNTYSTMVHEFQHLINFSDFYYNYNNQHSPMDLWLDEAFSMAAQDMFFGTQTSRISYVSGNSDIKDGLSLTHWGNGLASYSLSYLFGQYLRQQTADKQTGGDRIYKTILNTNYSDYMAVENALNSLGINKTFNEFVTDFYLATFMKQANGPYGFYNKSGFSALNMPIYSSTNGAALSLPPYAAILVKLNGAFTPSVTGSNIKFIGVNIK